MSDDEDTVIEDYFWCEPCDIFVWDSKAPHFRKVHQQTTTLRYTNGKSFDDGDSKKLITADDNRVRTSHPKKKENKSNGSLFFFFFLFTQQWVCPVCQDIFDLADSLKRHFQRSHNNSRGLLLSESEEEEGEGEEEAGPIQMDIEQVFAFLFPSRIHPFLITFVSQSAWNLSFPFIPWQLQLMPCCLQCILVTGQS